SWLPAPVRLGGDRSIEPELMDCVNRSSTTGKKMNRRSGLQRATYGGVRYAELRLKSYCAASCEAPHTSPRRERENLARGPRHAAVRLPLPPSSGAESSSALMAIAVTSLASSAAR